MLNKRELATVLAALRLFQKTGDEVVRQMVHFAGGIEPLTKKQIDELCEKLNFEEPIKLEYSEAVDRVANKQIEEIHQYFKMVNTADANIAESLEATDETEACLEALGQLGWTVTRDKERENHYSQEEEK